MSYVMSEMLRNVSFLSDVSLLSDGVYCLVQSIEDYFSTIREPMDQPGIPRPHSLQKGLQLLYRCPVVEVVVQHDGEDTAACPY